MGISLKLGGKPLVLARPRPTMLAVQRFLDSAPADELFTATLLQEKSGISAGSISSRSLHLDPALKNYTHRVNTVRYWGNPKAIKALREQVGQ